MTPKVGVGTAVELMLCGFEKCSAPIWTYFWDDEAENPGICWL